MLLRRFAFALCAVLPLAAAAMAAPSADGKCPPRAGMGMFTPEQRLMMFADLKAQVDSGAVDMRILRQMQRDKLKAMSEAQRTTYLADLTKRWTALAPADKAKLKADAEKWRSDHPRPEGDCPRPDKS
jgi:Spy/CpxP family protein refolding chaperone